MHAGAGWAGRHLVITAGDIGGPRRGRWPGRVVPVVGQQLLHDCALPAHHLALSWGRFPKIICGVKSSQLRGGAVRIGCAEAVPFILALSSASLQTFESLENPAKWAHGGVSGKSQISSDLARSAGGHGSEGSTYPTSSASFVGACLPTRHGTPELGWPVCAGPPAAAQSLRLRPRGTDEACGSLPTVGAMGGHSGTRTSG